KLFYGLCNAWCGLVTLDGQARRMPRGALLIADPRKPVGIAGIMGGSNSEIDRDTTGIVIESANFNAVNIRRTALALGLRTEASNRFEKSLDPELTLTGLACCLSLILGLVQEARAASPLTDVYPGPPRRPVIDLDARWTADMIGAPVGSERIHKILSSLQFEVEDRGEGQLRVTVPSFRAQKDVTIKQDLVEEVGRVYGYDNVTPADPVITSTTPLRDELQAFIRELRRTLSGDAALTEVYTYSFQEDGILDLFYPREDREDGGFVLLRNPVSSTLSRLRRSLVPGLYGLIERNAVLRERIGIYEIGATFHPPSTAGKLPEQRQTAAALMLEPAGDRPVFYRLKGKLELLLDKLGLPGARFAAAEQEREAALGFNRGGLGGLDGLHPGRTALATAGGRVFGVLGELHPRLLKEAGVDFHYLRAAVLELDAALLQELVSGRAAEKKYTPIPRYPEVTMAVAVVVDEQVQAQQVLDFIRTYPSELLSRVRLFDIYRGKPLPEGKKSLAFEIRYRRHDRTLTDQEAKAVHEGIAAGMRERGWELR
ncbi:MAG: phenylalanine--tRNA ligase subunit beta, partial [Spirochaetota bacterium]